MRWSASPPAPQAGVQGVIIYLLIYMAMTLGTFACILAMRRGETMVEDIDDLAGLSRTNPMMAFMLAMLLFSLAGIPPLAGFFAKFYVFLAAIESGLYVLAVIGVLASVVGAYYYLRIVKIMYFDEPVGGFAPMPTELRAVLGVSGAFILFFIFFAGQIGTRRGRWLPRRSSRGRWQQARFRTAIAASTTTACRPPMPMRSPPPVPARPAACG